jgi:hypothetical protein
VVAGVRLLVVDVVVGPRTPPGEVVIAFFAVAVVVVVARPPGDAVVMPCPAAVVAPPRPPLVVGPLVVGPAGFGPPALELVPLLAGLDGVEAAGWAAPLLCF